RLSPEVSPATRTNKGLEACELDLGSDAAIMRLRSSVTGAPSGTDHRFLPDTGVRRTRSSSNDSDPFPPRRGLVQEGYQGNELRLRFGAAFQLGNGLDQLASGPIKDLVRLANVSDLLRREAASLEPFDVHAVRLRRAADRHDVRRNVARDRSVVRNERVRADFAELMNSGEASHVDPVAHLDMTTQRGVIREHAVRPDDAVVTDVGAGHEKIVVCNPGHEPILGRTTIDGAVLTKRVAIADLEPRRLTFVFQVLRSCTDRGKLVDAIVAPDRGRSFDDDMRPYLAAGCDGNIRPYHRICTNLDGTVEVRTRMNDSGRMDRHGG